MVTIIEVFDFLVESITFVRDFIIDFIIEILIIFFPIIIFLILVFIGNEIAYRLGWIKPFGHFDCFGTKNPELMKLRMELLEKALERENEEQRKR